MIDTTGSLGSSAWPQHIAEFIIIISWWQQLVCGFVTVNLNRLPIYGSKELNISVVVNWQRAHNENFIKAKWMTQTVDHWQQMWVHTCCCWQENCWFSLVGNINANLSTFAEVVSKVWGLPIQSHLDAGYAINMNGVMESLQFLARQSVNVIIEVKSLRMIYGILDSSLTGEAFLI